METILSSPVVAQAYLEKFKSMPSSQQKEALRRISAKGLDPTVEDPRTTDVITRISEAYGRKKIRSKQSASVRRQEIKESLLPVNSAGDSTLTQDDSSFVRLDSVPADTDEVEIVAPNVRDTIISGSESESEPELDTATLSLRSSVLYKQPALEPKPERPPAAGTAATATTERSPAGTAATVNKKKFNLIVSRKR